MFLKELKKSILAFAMVFPIIGICKPISISSEVSKELRIPNNYSELKNKDLLNKLNPAIRCDDGDFDISKYRFLITIPLKDKEFLAAACELGAYQDHYITYLISKSKDKTYAHALGWLEPVYVDNKWKLAPTYEMGGVIKLNEGSTQLINMRRYVSRWTCGFTAYYFLPLSDDKFIKPDRVEADHDCDNGIRYDGWPEIDVSKMEVLREHPVYELKD